MLFRPASFTRQPQYAPPLNRNSSLTRGIQFLILPTVGGGAPIDLVAGNAVAWSTVGSGGNRATVDGLGWNIATATTDAVQASVSGLSFPFSMGVVMVPNAGAAGNWIASACNGTVANTNSRVGLKMDFLGDVSASSSNASGTSTADQTTNKITVGEPQAIAGTFASVTNRKSFLNGRAGTGNTGSNIPASIDTLCVGSGAASGTRASAQTGAYQLFVYWNRALTDAEAIEFTRNPWQIFEQRPQIGWLDAVAGSGNTPISASDSGTGSDGADIAASISASDSGAGTDSTAVAATLGPSDAGTGSDTGSVGATFTPSDSATGSDAISVTYNIAAADAGTGADTAGIAASITAADSADSATGSDSISVAAAIAAADVAAGAELGAIAAQVAGTDAATGADSVQAAQLTLVNLGDSAVGSDAILVELNLRRDSPGGKAKHRTHGDPGYEQGRAARMSKQAAAAIAALILSGAI